MKILLSKSEAIKFINKNRRLNFVFEECNERMFDYVMKIQHEYWEYSKVSELKKYSIKKVLSESTLPYELSI